MRLLWGLCYTGLNIFYQATISFIIVPTSHKGVTLIQFRFSERAQGIVEYALLLVLVSLVVLAILVLLGPAIGNAYSNITANI